eukprot:1274871-Amorphochlora_amoeboformis.AAC.1
MVRGVVLGAAMAVVGADTAGRGFEPAPCVPIALSEVNEVLTIGSEGVEAVRKLEVCRHVDNAFEVLVHIPLGLRGV